MKRLALVRSLQIQSPMCANQQFLLMSRMCTFVQVTVSTVGLVPEIRRFCAQSRSQLAVSLHATTDEVRDWIAPVNRRWKLAQLVEVLQEHFPAHDRISQPRDALRGPDKTGR